MADNEITVIDETEGAGKANVDTVSLTGVDSKTVHRQITIIGSPSTFGRKAEVNASSELLVKHTDSIAMTNANLDAALSTLATQATLALIKAKTDNLDDTISTRATEATLAIVSGNVADIEALISARTNTLGQKTMASSMPVVLSSDQSSIPVSLSEPISVDDNGGSLTVDGTVTANVSDNAVRDNGKIDIAGFDVALPSGTNNIGDVDIASIAAGSNRIGKATIRNSADSADIDPLAESTFTGRINTQGQKTMSASTPIVIASDQSAIPVTPSQSTASSLKNEPAGNVAHDSADSGNPIKVGGKARTANPTAVSDGDRVDATFDDIGRIVIVPHQVRDLIIKNTITLTSTTETTLLAAAASTFHDLLMVVISNTSASAVRVDFRDTTSGTVIFSVYAPAGATVGFNAPVAIPQTTVNTNWTAQLSSGVTDVRIFAVGVKNV